jgi:hypothetical protein
LKIIPTTGPFAATTVKFTLAIFTYYFGRKVSSKSSKSGTDPSLNLSHQNKIKNMYPPASTTVGLHSDIEEMQEIISENSESEFDSRRSEGTGSWNDFQMQVSSNNSESDGSRTGWRIHVLYLILMREI